MWSEIPPEQFAAAVDTCAREVLAEGSIAGPPVDALLLARRLELLVARDSSMEGRARFVRLGQGGGAGKGTILLADEPRAERRHWAIAHEVGESVAHRVFAALGIPLVDIPVAGRERVANQLASGLLLPHDWFAADGNALDWDLLELKQIYSTASHELLARRMLEMRPPVIVTLFDQGQTQWRQSNVVGRPPRLTTPELETWRTSHERGKAAKYCGQDLPEGIEDVRCWAVHEPGWRREILRMELEGW
ncbi:MAG: ImmA/IrrE family metallo-endopeptidase [Planctomycetes bacterium]|nr:ImmA/IrrE family metallo-endopeptidase [Planctomycetota bacterium]